jgi:hypothetical protein
MIWDSPNVLGEVVLMWHGTCRNCSKDSLHGACCKAVGKRIRYHGLHSEYKTPVAGEGICLEQHDSHGLYIVVMGDNGLITPVDPTTVEIL